MVAAAALNERDGAGNDGTLARANTARQMGKIGNGGPTTQRNEFAQDARPREAFASLPPVATRSPFRRNFNGIIRRQTGIIRNWLMTSDLARHSAGQGTIMVRGWGFGRDACVEPRARPLAPYFYSPALPQIRVGPPISSGRSKTRSGLSSRFVRFESSRFFALIG